jgi:hypothetical protein
VDVEDVEDVRRPIGIPREGPASLGTAPEALHGSEAPFPSAPSQISHDQVSTWGLNVLDVRNVLTDGPLNRRGPAAAVLPAARENALKPLAALLATGYLRMLGQRAADPAVGPPPGNSAKPLDSLRAKSVNGVR